MSSDFDLDGLVNLYDEIIFGKGQRPNYIFEIPKESSNSDVISNFHFGDNLILKFNYESEHEYFSNLNPTISESLRFIANQVAYDFSKQNHGVFCDFNDDSIKKPFDTRSLEPLFVFTFRVFANYLYLKALSQ